MPKRFLSAAFFTVFLALACAGESRAVMVEDKTDKVSVSLVAKADGAAPNEEVDVLVKLRMHDGWHTYWANPGDAGLATNIRWRLPEGYRSSDVWLSKPDRFLFEELVQYGYGDTAYLKTSLIPEKTGNSKKNPGEKMFSATVSWLACRDVCVPESVKLDFSLPADQNDDAGRFWKEEFDKALQTFPVVNDWKSYYTVSGGRLLINVETSGFDFAKNIKKISFIPYQKDKIDNKAEQKVGYDGSGALSVEIPLEDTDISELSGLLILEQENSGTAYELTPVLREKLQVYNPINYDDYSLFLVILMAFAGGVILNFMPCIFPILTIKAISLAQSSYNKQKNRIEALLYFAGVVVSFFLIATVLIFLRSKGEQIGWGFQLQSPVFVGIMMVIFFIIFLMLLDIVNLKNPFASRVGRISFKKQQLNAFVTGFFAVLIASPCTGPFMGIAIGYTLAKPIYIYYPVFLALSVGYALPFTLIGLFPHALHKILPKPGKWMEILKKIFAVPVFLTIVWLGWVLFNQINASAAKKYEEVFWQPYDKEKVAALTAVRQPVFIDFTAKWCITCLANEKMALQSEEFLSLVRERKINIFKADWTNRDKDVTDALAYYGRNSVPLYVYYGGETANYVILPQLLTPGILKQYIK